MFSKMVIYIFCVVGFFAVLFSFIPGQFFEAAFSSSIGADKEVAERFAMANVTLYGNAGGQNMTYQYSSYWDDGDWEAGLPTGHFLEVIWYDAGGNWPYGKSLELRHIQQNLYWVDLLHRLALTPKTYDGTWEQAPAYYIFHPNHLENSWSDDANASVFYAECNHLDVTILFEYNQSEYNSITEAWNGGDLGYLLSYDVDWNSTNISAFTVLSKLLTFQNPDLGIPGDAGTIFNMAIAIPMWVMTAILIIILVQSVIPLIRGIPD